MNLEVAQAIGGLALFLLGMVIMTEGLRGLAGDALQRALRRVTRSPATGAAAGALATAVVQSSSATTVTAVGFAGAGLLTFPEALGVVFGANVGTTVTGWMVALLGFKLNLGAGMSLAVLAGVLLRLLAKGRAASGGYALAGFGLIFVGIDGLRVGMAGLESFVAPDALPPDTLFGRLQLVGIGVAVTLVTQSSSAGVAAALVAVSAGAIGFSQAAAMVIGMDVGTTVTAALATVGASLPARRTGWAHVIYNLITAVLAFSILPAFVWILEAWSPGSTTREPELSLVGFHSFFNVLGVAAVIPLAGPFASLVERLVPERPAPFTERLDEKLLREPSVAMRAVAPTLETLARGSFDLLREQLGPGGSRDRPEQRALITLALAAVRDWLGRIETPLLGAEAKARELAALHVVDHLRRLVDREGQTRRVETLREAPELKERARELSAALAPEATHASALGALAQRLAERRPEYRAAVLGRATGDHIDAAAALARLDAYRWLERVTHHTWRTAHHLEQLGGETPPLPEVEPPEPE